MNWNRYVTHLVATLCLALACVAAQSQEDPRIGELSYLGANHAPFWFTKNAGSESSRRLSYPQAWERFR